MGKYETRTGPSCCCRDAPHARRLLSPAGGIWALLVSATPGSLAGGRRLERRRTGAARSGGLLARSDAPGRRHHPVVALVRWPSALAGSPGGVDRCRVALG